MSAIARSTGIVLALGVGAAFVARWRGRQRAIRDIRGQVVLVTGGSRGLGFLLAREFARNGGRVAICARNEIELARARDVLAREGIDVLAIVADVSDRDRVNDMIDEVRRRLGPIDILVNNAGVIQVGPIADQTDATFEQSMSTMFWGVLYPTLAVLPDMRARGRGHLVNVTSIGGKVAVPHMLPYGAAKFAAVGLSEGLRAELAGQGITVTTIVPGLMRTGSFLNAQFVGRQYQEFTWFSLAASLPLISMDATAAARQIVEATKRGEAERILSIPAVLIARLHGLFPGATSNLLGLVNRYVLPPADGQGREIASGLSLDERHRSKVLATLETLGRSAARRFLEYPAVQSVRH